MAGPSFFLAWLAAAALALTAGCQSLDQAMGKYDPRLRPEQQAYEDTLRPRLAKGSLYAGPATELLATALPLSPSVRQAMAQRQALANGLPPEQAQALVTAARQEAEQGLEVVLCLYTPERERGDLAARNPSWRLWLVMGEERIGPSDLRQVRDRSSLHEALYPFWGPWESLWRVRFPARPAGEARLVITGAPGRVEMRLPLD